MYFVARELVKVAKLLVAGKMPYGWLLPNGALLDCSYTSHMYGIWSLYKKKKGKSKEKQFAINRCLDDSLYDEFTILRATPEETAFFDRFGFEFSEDGMVDKKSGRDMSMKAKEKIWASVGLDVADFKMLNNDPYGYGYSQGYIRIGYGGNNVTIVLPTKSDYKRAASFMEKRLTPDSMKNTRVEVEVSKGSDFSTSGRAIDFVASASFDDYMSLNEGDKL